MPLFIKPRHLKRYRDFISLLIRYGRSDLLKSATLDELILQEGGPAEVDAGKRPEALAEELESLGPTFIKLGQLLSTRPDLLPIQYLEALSRLQDRVQPFDFEQVREIVSTELDVDLEKAFRTFDPVPIAAASLGQVHRAVTRDGHDVAVKVQRPGIRKRILDDLEVLDEIASFVDKHTEMGRRYVFHDMLEEFRRSLLRELDYRQEAQNMLVLGKNLSDYERIVIPEPIADFTTSRVLTMSFIDGAKVTALSAAIRLEMNGAELAEDLSKAYLDQVLVHGFFHADPHPGNVFVTPDYRLALIDLGMVARIGPEMQDELLRLLLAMVSGRGRQVADLSRRMGTVLEGHDEARFNRAVTDLVVRFRHSTMADVKVGRILTEIAHIAGSTGVRPAVELTMLGKTLLNLDEVSRTLAPDFDPNEAIRSHVDDIIRQRLLGQLTSENLVSTTLEVNEFVQQFPVRANSMMKALADNRFVIGIDAIDEVRFLENLHSIANRISFSLVLAALIIGAAMLMQVETAFTILGYPGIAMIFFLIAAAMGFVLVISNLMKHVQEGRGDRPR